MICTEKKGTCTNLAVYAYLWPWEGNGNTGNTCLECLPILRSLEQQLARPLTLMPIIAPAEAQRDISHLQTQLAASEGRQTDLGHLLRGMEEREASALRELGHVRDELARAQLGHASTVEQLEQEVGSLRAELVGITTTLNDTHAEMLVLRELARMLDGAVLSPNVADVLNTWQHNHVPTQQG